MTAPPPSAATTPTSDDLLLSGDHPALTAARRRWTPLGRALLGIAWSVIVVMLLALPALVDSLALRRYASLLVLALGVLAVVVATGHAGLITLGHGAFVGLGAFAMGWFLDNRGWPFIVSLVATFVFCTVVGWVLGIPALRIKGIYLALVTLGIAVVFPSLAKRFPEVTGGTTGRPIAASLEPPSWTGLGPEHVVAWRYYFCLAVCAIMFLATRNVVIGRMGRAMQAVRDGEVAAATFGVNLIRVKAGAFGLSAGLAGTAGSLQVVLFPFVSHEQFDVFLSFRLYAAAVLGGVAFLIGAVYGVLALIAVPTLNETIGGLTGNQDGLLKNDVIVFGAGLVALTFVSPDGIAGLVNRLSRRLFEERDD